MNDKKTLINKLRVMEAEYEKDSSMMLRIDY